jgi:hypothetical protein
MLRYPERLNAWNIDCIHIGEICTIILRQGGGIRHDLQVIGFEPMTFRL